MRAEDGDGHRDGCGGKAAAAASVLCYGVPFSQSGEWPVCEEGAWCRWNVFVLELWLRTASGPLVDEFDEF